LLIAFGAPIAVSLVVWAVGLPFVGILSLVEKIKQRREPPYYNENLRAEFSEQASKVKNTEDFPLVEVQSFPLYLMDKGVHTRAEFIGEGKAMMKYSEATIARALDNLVEARLIKRIGRDIYYRIGARVQENDIVEEPASEQATDAHRLTSMLFELEKERKKQSNTFGIWSLVLGIIGIFTFFGLAISIAAIILGILQFRRHRTKCSMAGLALGIIGVALFIVLIRWLGYEIPYTVSV